MLQPREEPTWPLTLAIRLSRINREIPESTTDEKAEAAAVNIRPEETAG